MLSNNNVHHEPHNIHPARPPINLYYEKQGGLTAFPVSKPIQTGFDWTGLYPSDPTALKSLDPAAKANKPSVVYRNSKECRPFMPMLHNFEGSQFGEDFISDSENYEHWFNSDAFFCAAAFIESGQTEQEIVSVMSMLFVTENSVAAFLAGDIGEEQLMPYYKGARGAPVVYYSSMVSKSAMSSIQLYKIILRDIKLYKTKNSAIPKWGFSIALNEKAIDHLINSGFYSINTNNLLNKYGIFKIDNCSKKSKIWSSILSGQPCLEREPSSITTNMVCRVAGKERMLQHSSVAMPC